LIKKSLSIGRKTSKIIYNGQIDLIQECHKNFLESGSCPNGFLFKIGRGLIQKERFSTWNKLGDKRKPSAHAFLTNLRGEIP